ncbi:hypothetical protein [Herbaspirillum sp. CF444]|nr:hypothetical protein [Herbaspirillum sp. CF444]
MRRKQFDKKIEWRPSDRMHVSSSVKETKQGVTKLQGMFQHSNADGD